MLAVCQACLTLISHNLYSSSLKLMAFSPVLTGEEVETQKQYFA